ncbi:MAG: trimethylamine methyltransferase family protein [Thermodesulfobacteriota bacterium]
MYRVLSESEIGLVHEASLEILSEMGFQVDNRRAREILRQHGAVVRDGKRVLLPRSLVENCLAQVPGEFTLYGRREENDAHYQAGSFYTSTGGSAMYVLDLETGERRLSTCQDLHDIMALVDQLDQIDLISLPIYLNDLPKQDVDINRFFAGLKNSTKHVMGAVYTVAGLDKVAAMAEIIAGDRWTERPIVSVVLCPIISPLRLDETATEILVEAAARGIITHNFNMVQAGCTAPVTIAGTLTLMNAEVLAVTTLIQLIKPGLPCFYCSVPGLTDMATGMFVTGGIESALLNAGATQMARYYHLPNWATAGRTDAKIPDAQAGYEHALTVPYVCLAGASHVTCGTGFLDFVLTVSFEQYVIDNEIIGMVRRMKRGVTVNEDTIGLEVIKAVGPGGHFLAEHHTVKYMRSEFFQPRLSDRRERDIWLNQGGKDTWQRARELAKKLIQDHNRSGLTDQQERDIVSRIEGIVARPSGSIL